MTASFSLLLSPHFPPFPFSSKNSHSFLTVILKDRPPPWYDAVYVPPHHRLRSGISSARSHFSISSLPHFQTEKQLNNKTDYNINHDNNDNYNNFSCNDNSKISQSNSAYSDGVSEEESDRELEMSLQPGASPSNNIEDWRWKLTMLLCNKEKQELISREKNDRRDFEQISALASSMGLYSHLYAKVVVFSKVPLPNYRFDLDDRRPLREDHCEGRFVLGRQVFQPSKPAVMASQPALVLRIESGPGGDNSKSQLQTLLTRAGYATPTYKTKRLKNNQFRATVEFNGMQIMGQRCSNKKSAEKDAAAEAVQWLMGGIHTGREFIIHMSILLKKSKKDHY